MGVNEIVAGVSSPASETSFRRFCIVNTPKDEMPSMYKYPKAGLGEKDQKNGTLDV